MSEGGSEIFLKSNDNLTVYCMSGKIKRCSFGARKISFLKEKLPNHVSFLEI